MTSSQKQCISSSGGGGEEQKCSSGGDSFAQVRDAQLTRACRERLLLLYDVSSWRRLHGMPNAQLGLLWCALVRPYPSTCTNHGWTWTAHTDCSIRTVRRCPLVVVSEVTQQDEVVAEICQRVPYWGREPGVPEHFAAALSHGQLLLASAAQMAFGLHGAFSYMAQSLVVSAVSRLERSRHRLNGLLQLDT
jgi:hypothetical protein